MNSTVAIIIFIQGTDFVSVFFDSDTVVKIARSDVCGCIFELCNVLMCNCVSVSESAVNGES